MVLINGVKYACERCIRGHRVTTCTHTDQPLTMIKPKGRPASQCQYCREQRKLKNTHTRCSCGKKGKSPGTHLASCACHKNSQCTCCVATVKKGDKNKKKTIKSDVTNDNDQGVNSSGGSFSSSGLLSHCIVEDVPMPFETGSGLFDLFSPTYSSSSNIYLNNKNENSNSDSVSASDSSSTNLNALPGKATKSAIDESNGDPNVQMVDNMFPLFPLVGTHSFDDSKSQPLSSIPQSTMESFPEVSTNENHEQNTKSSRINGNPFTQQEKNPYQHNNARQTIHYQPIRPKRPESVLSMASNSSTGTNTSRNFESLSNLGVLSNQSNQTNFSPSMSANVDLENGSKINTSMKDSRVDGIDLFESSSQKTQTELDNFGRITENDMSDTGFSENESLDKRLSQNLPNSPTKANQDPLDFDFSIPLLNDFVNPLYDQRADLHS